MDTYIVLRMSEPSGEKTKLTLGIDKEVIKKAKAAGINISSITEQLLNVMTSGPNTDIVKSFEAFLNALRHILIKNNISLTIGQNRSWDYKNQEPIDNSINLDRDGTLYIWHDESESAFKVSLSEVLNDLYPPNQILNNLFQELIKVTENNKAKLQELNFALKLLKTLSEEEKK
jgi:hypothetical protein